MLKTAQFLAGLLALALFAFTAIYLFNPAGASAARGFEPIGSAGITSVRVMAAGFLMMAIMTAIGAFRKEAVFLMPAAIFFLTSLVIRFVSVFVDGADASDLRVFVPATLLFVVAEFVLQTFRRNGTKPGAPVTQ